MRAILTLLLITLSLSIKSQIFLTNKTAEPISVAVAIYHNTKEFKGWVSSGWIKIIPNETKALNNGGSGTNDVFYYYAVSESGKAFEGSDGDKKILINPKPFTIKNCDMDYALDQNPGSTFKTFRKIKMNARKIQTKYTFELSY